MLSSKEPQQYYWNQNSEEAFITKKNWQHKGTEQKNKWIKKNHQMVRLEKSAFDSEVESDK